MLDIYRMIYFFLLSLFYISTTTRHTLENRRFLEANSNEKFCGTIRETLCECAAPSSMESYIYNIACLCVSYMSRVGICMYFRVFALCTCACLRVLRYSCVFSLVFSLSSSLTRILSLIPFSHPSIPALLRFFRALSHIPLAHVLSARLSLLPCLYFLTFRVRSPLFDIPDSRISMGLNSTSRREKCAKPNGNRNRSSFDLASLVDGRFHPPFASPRARIYCRSFFLSLLLIPFFQPVFPSLSLIAMHTHTLSLSLSLPLVLSVSICDESSLKILYSVVIKNKKIVTLYNTPEKKISLSSKTE